jgi:hypothetical protein
VTLFAELRRRGVLGAVVAYGVAAAGALQLADIVVHALDLPAWLLRALIWVAALGLPFTFIVSWFYDLTRHGFVRTQLPGTPPQSPSAPLPRSMIQELQKGAVLAGRYHLEGDLGKGAMGRVLAARDEKLGRRVAIKVITGEHDPGRIQRFIQEARTAGALEHPNVIAVYDLGEHEGLPFLVTELLEGHTLRTLLRSSGLPSAQAQALSAQLARGLAAAHARGIVHRDLKPENLFVTGDGRLKILDFGLARLITNEPAPGLTQTGAVFGTPGYLSPEQARGERVGPRSDIFSAGAVIYEMFSGRRAFPGESLIESGHAALTAEPQPLPLTTPPAVEAILSRALQKDPARRFADGGELSRAFEALAPGAALPIAAAGRSWRRSTALMVALAAVALGAMISSGLRVSHSVRANASRFAAHAAQAQHGTLALPEIHLPIPPTLEVPEPPEAVDGLKIAREVTRQMQKRTPHWGLSGVLSGVRALEIANQPQRAEGLLRKQRDPIAHLELFLLLRRHGRTAEGKSDLLAYLRSAGDDWPTPLLRAYAGQMHDQAVLARAEGDADELCEARYYLGLLHVPADVAASRSLLEKAANEECDESDEAREALQELGGSR